MDKTDILAKTAKGTEEIQSRVHGLPQKLRALLIVVNGKQSVATLVQRFGGLGDVEASFAGLLAQGFVQVVSAGAHLAVDGRTPSTGEAPEETREQAVRGLCSLVYEMLGPDADIFTEQLERARTRTGFLAALERAHGVVAGLRGAKQAARLDERGMTIASRHFAD